MTDKKLTDEEIIQRLERCVKRGDRNYDTDIVLDLINRQNAEIERLKSANDEKFRQWVMLAEKTKQHYANLYEEAKDILKAQAYKEFGYKLKNKIINTPFGINCTGETDEYRDGCLRGLVAKQHNVIDMIDNLVKETVGED